ncbi:MAG: hypothetical protein QM764_14045 [Chitinophagaceae bacterium]
MSKIFLFFFILSIGHFNYLYGQMINNDPGKSYLNIALPRSPESQSIEKYGDIPIDEFSGTPAISFPLYTLKSRFLEVPVALSYHASGIKISQEATWTGLGFDILAGGRITVQTRGNIDDYVRHFYPTNANGVTRIFNRFFGGSFNTSAVGYAFLDYCNNPECHPGDLSYDDKYTVGHAAWEGTGEPDIYYANFLGNNLAFYFDLVTDEVKFIGEKSLFAISATRDGFGHLLSFIITDNDGNKNYFEQREQTTLLIPGFYGAASNPSSTTAWLLTKTVHPQGDIINFSYSGYGKSYPVFDWSSSISTTYPSKVIDNLSSDWPQNQAELETYYLSSIESNNTLVNFFVSGREDIRGIGSKKLDEIKVVDKISGNVIKEIAFDYAYFTSASDGFESGFLPDSLDRYYRKRLTLSSVTFKGDQHNLAYKFYYNHPLAFPSKLSFAQDHWGFYNGYGNDYNGHSPLALIPKFADLGFLATREINNKLPCLTGLGGQETYTIPNGFDGFAASRNCNPNVVAYMTLDSIVFPTGGKTQFVFEPHHSSYWTIGNNNDFVGGGLRIKSIKNYSSSDKLETVTEYKYEQSDGGRTSGIYLGRINYLKVSNKFPSGTTATLSSCGILNEDNETVGYSRVKIIYSNSDNNANNGYRIKYYNVTYPNIPIYRQATAPFYKGTDATPFDVTGVRFLLKDWSNIAPTPVRSLDGKLYLEEVYNSANVRIKSTNYYYRQADYSQKFYSLKVEDNYGMSSATYEKYVAAFEGTSIPAYGCDGGRWRRWSICVTPAKSFFTLLDSVVDKTYISDNINIVQKKEYRYNQFYQPEYVVSYNSDGSQTINYFKRPLSYPTPTTSVFAAGNATSIESLKNNHIYNLPIEEIVIKKSMSGDFGVKSARFNIYQGTLLTNSYLLETNKMVRMNTEFTPSYYNIGSSTYDIAFDSKYKLNESVSYTTSSLAKDIQQTSGVKAFIWDEIYNKIIAQADNATSDNIAYTSFETVSNGNWTFTGIPVADATSPTGKKCYVFGGDIVRSGLSIGSNYIVSCWKKSGNVSVNGTSSVAGRTVNGWTYYEHKVVNPPGGVITVSGMSASIDELRLCPAKSLFTTYTYAPLGGIASQCDPNNKIMYYEYDDLGRLKLIRDQDNNIIKKFDYQYQAKP